MTARCQTPTTKVHTLTSIIIIIIIIIFEEIYSARMDRLTVFLT